MELRTEIKLEDYKEFCFLVGKRTKMSRRAYRRTAAVLLAVFAACLGFSFAFLREYALLALGAVISAFMAVGLAALLIGARLEDQRFAAIAQIMELTARVSIDESGIRTRADDGLHTDYHAWAMVEKVTVSQRLIVFSMITGVHVMVNKDQMTEEEFQSVIMPHLQGKKVIFRRS